jgi:hypothetical protein
MSHLLFLFHSRANATVDRNGSIRANYCTNTTARASLRIYHHGRVIPCRTKALNIQRQNLERAVCYAELTGFTILFVDFYPSLSGHADPPFS